MRKRSVVAAGCGLVSGVVSALLVEPDDYDEFIIYWGAGIVFGIVFAGFVYRVLDSERVPRLLLRCLLFAGLSAVAYRAAVQVYVLTSGNLEAERELLGAVPGVCAGLAGSFILAMSLRICGLGRPSIRQVLITVLVGGVLGLLMMVPDVSLFGVGLNFLILYGCWQMGVAMALAAALPGSASGDENA